MEKRLVLALLLSFAVILLYTRIMAPAAHRGAERAEEKPVVIEKQESEQPESVSDARKGAEIKLKTVSPAGKLSTASSRDLDVSFDDARGCISGVVLKRSDVIKKGPVEVTVPLGLGYQPGDLANLGPLEWERIESAGAAAPSGGGTEIAFKTVVRGLNIVKSYHVPGQGFVVKAKISIANAGNDTVELADGMDIGAGTIFALTPSERDSIVGADYQKKDGAIKRISAGKLKTEMAGQWEGGWLALRNQFFALVARPEKTEAMRYVLKRVMSEDERFGVTGLLRLKSVVLKPGEGREMAFSFYIGPKEYSALNSFGAAGVMDFGWFGIIGKIILRSLNMLYGLCGNYGLAIILLTAIIRVVLYPLNQKSFRSMKEMQALQPKILALQEKYKGDPKKKQEEMMRIYKEHGVNPAGGCLPLLIQMPILIAFFRVLQNAIELWGAPFYLWIKDLSAPDALLKISTGKNAIPLIGKIVDGHAYVFLNVLPILMLVVFFIQQKLTPVSAATTPEQQQQQKMMNYMMPVVFGVMFYNLPSGLNLYFAVSTLLGILQQKYMIR